MRAVVVRQFSALDGASVVEVPDPVPGPGQVLVEVHAVPVNYVDLVTFLGEYQFKPALPYTPGKGPAGIVRAVGEGVTAHATGDRVLAMGEQGGHAELVVVEARDVYRLRAATTFVDAAAISLAFDTAWVALHERARLCEGEKVLVLGATSAVGGAAIQLAKAMGAVCVIGAVSRAERVEAATEAGADVVIDLSAPDPRERVRLEVLEATGGAGVDVIVDVLGGDAFDAAIRALAWRGRLVVVGFASGRIATLRTNYLLLKNIEVSGLQISDYRKRAPEVMSACFADLFGLLERAQIRPPQSTTLPLEGWSDALAAIQSRSTTDRFILLPQS